MADRAVKTEHSGAKHGSGAYWGRKADAKAESNTLRRRVGLRDVTVELELRLTPAGQRLMQEFIEELDDG